MPDFIAINRMYGLAVIKHTDGRYHIVAVDRDAKILYHIGVSFGDSADAAKEYKRLKAIKASRNAAKP